jgi:ubiquinol-cytochrome c reductase cytochrome c subunit
MFNVHLFASIAVVSLLTFSNAFAADVAKGKTAYVKNGCWQCHGFVGQGGIAGPKLAPEPMPLAAMNVFLRNTKGAMPPYMEAVLSNEDLADIHAYLQSIPKAADYKTIPLLNQP